MSNIAAEIQIIARILREKKLCFDTSPLTNGYKKGECNVVKLKFNINKDFPPNTKPSLSMLEVLLDVVYIENTKYDIPISNYCFRVTAIGHNQDGDYISSWHLDYDDQDGHNYIHPHFHMTWGGDKVKDLNLGNVLLLPTPRISYPPMDIVLGIDFVLSNFFRTDIYQQFWNEPQYVAAVKNAQDKYWKPYILSLAHHWCKNHCLQTQYNDNNAKHFYPTLTD